MVKPLKELLLQADEFLGMPKQASAVMPDEVSSLADTLKFASSIENGFVPAESEDINIDIEKTAKTLNKIAAQAELEVMIQCNAFEKAALADGYSREQINEALQKIAAKKVHKNLGVLVSIGGLSPSKEDLNSLDTVKKREIGEEVRRHPATKSFGGAR
jgi:biopolymer transport protein ExbB/TolQ